MKKIMGLLSLLLVVCLVALSGCTDKKLTVGIVQYVTAEALDNARVGIIEGLKEQGYVDGDNIKIKIYNPQANASDLALASEQAIEDCDIIFAIATPVALSLQSEAEKQGSNVPILFTAVTDPVESGIIEDAQNPGGNITGTNDMNPVSAQVDLIKELFPGQDGLKLGVVYTSTEPNSIIQVGLARTECANIGVTLVERQITSANDLTTAVEALVAEGIDALYLPTDNLVSASVSAVTRITNLNKIPTICGESGMFSGGGTITYGINYTELGKLTGQMGAAILKGEKTAANTASCGLTNFELWINKTVAEESEISIPSALLEKEGAVIK